MSSTGYPTWEEAQLRNLDRFDEVIATIRTMSEIVEELRRGMAALAEVMATGSDLEDAKAELREVIAEATATPFDPEEHRAN